MEKKYVYNAELPFITEGCRGNVMIDGKYAYEWGEDKIPYKKVLQSLMTIRKIPRWGLHDDWTPEVQFGSNFFHKDHNAYIWLGHSTFFFKLGNAVWITDPIFYDLSILMKRRHPMPCNIDELPSVDHILLSHGHRDHLDVKSLKKILNKNANVQVYCPLGHVPMLRKIGFKYIQEAAWYQKYSIDAHTELVLCPAIHWNRRYVSDYNSTLWGSFYLKTEGLALYFGGDTAYGSHFLDIKEKMGSPDYVFMPVGAYKPRAVMSWAHISPQQALVAFEEMGARYFVPMHYGTYRLSAESAKEPIAVLGKSPLASRIIVPNVGEECCF